MSTEEYYVTKDAAVKLIELTLLQPRRKTGRPMAYDTVRVGYAPTRTSSLMAII